jgi:hypothetical protein
MVIQKEKKSAMKLMNWRIEQEADGQDRWNIN